MAIAYRYLAVMTASAQVHAILRADGLRWHLLEVVQALHLPDCWIGAGFVRNAVWDYLHERAPTPPAGDVDVIWHDLRRADPAEDREHEAALRAAEPSIFWSVKNQARMHVRNDDTPYASATDAMRFWPETATAVAARRVGSSGCEVAAPLGLDDLVALVLRPTPHFTGAKHSIFQARLRAKGWTSSWPKLRVLEA